MAESMSSSATVEPSDTGNILHPKWKSISLTHVEYEQGDIIGFLLAWTSLIPMFIFVSMVTLIIFRRDLHTFSYCFGLLLNEVVNWILKHIIRETRPARDGRDNSQLVTEFGMPSSHSQFMWFFSSYMVLFLFIRVYKNYNFIDDLWKYLVALFSFAMTIAVSCSRVYLFYHTNGQVLWGAVVGAVLGIVWFSIVQCYLTSFFPLIAASPLGEFLMMRDSTLIPHVMWFEYTSSRTEARSRQRKVTSRKSL